MKKSYYLLISLSMLLVNSQLLFAAQKRIALVIGNADYTNIGALKNPVNDAKGMDKVLRKMGFTVIKGTNLSRKQMRTKIRKFGNMIKSADVALFYFAGHGLQYDGSNYLVPVKTNIESEDEIMDEAINASSVLRKMESAGTGVNIVVLDACRNNPFKRSFRSASRGLTRIEGPKGSLIAYATAPGSVAADGKGSNGLYTENLIKYIQEPIPLEKVFKKVRNAVSAATEDKQIPWENSSLTGEDFFFNLNKTNTISKQAFKPATPTTGSLLIRSNVSGDMVIINGKKRGASELSLKLKPGSYYIEVTKKGYKPFEQSYTVIAGIEQTLYAKLKKLHINVAKVKEPQIKAAKVKVAKVKEPIARPLQPRLKQPVQDIEAKANKSTYSIEQQRAIDLFNNM